MKVHAKVSGYVFLADGEPVVAGRTKKGNGLVCPFPSTHRERLASRETDYQLEGPAASPGSNWKLPLPLSPLIENVFMAY